MTTPVRELLEHFLVEEADLSSAIQQGRRAVDPTRQGHFRCRCGLAVRRALDPETAILKQVEVFLRQVETGFEVYAIEGLDIGSEL